MTRTHLTAQPHAASEFGPMMVTPRLAAFGPALHLHTLAHGGYDDDHAQHASAAHRLVRVTLSTLIGLLILVTPMATLAYASQTIATSTNVNGVPVNRSTQPVNVITVNMPMLTPAH